jgi:hypothetical protein
MLLDLSVSKCSAMLRKIKIVEFQVLLMAGLALCLENYPNALALVGRSLAIDPGPGVQPSVLFLHKWELLGREAAWVTQ